MLETVENIKAAEPVRFVTVFLDILGTSRQLLMLDKALDDGADEVDIQRLKKESLLPTQQLRSLVDNVYQDLKKTEPESADVDGLSEHQAQLLKETERDDSICQWASDSLVISVPILMDAEIRTLAAVFNLFKVCAATSLFMLAAGHPLRGAVSVGWGMQVTDDEVVGAGIVKAHAAEQDHALYPRIIVKPEILRFLSEFAARIARDREKADLAKEISRRIKDLVCDDLDGMSIVDFLCPAALEGLAELPRQALLERAHSMLQAYLRRSREVSDLPLLRKYSWLSNYWTRRVQR
ncbi:MAG: hypothetical protein JSV91_12640 [Phycisphaerales bacterium]|nr:MAG: hypothetical protein JSV91_12640 [Phycisphaerales bacterium]